MSQINVRTTTAEDATIISQFNQQMAMETENKVLPPEIISRGVARLMDKPEYGFYLIAESDSRPVGTCMVTTEWSDWRDGLFWWIQSVYVQADFRRKGVYRQMYHTIQSLAAKEPDVCGYRLYVEKENTGAQKTYESLGMSATDYLLYETINS